MRANPVGAIFELFCLEEDVVFSCPDVCMIFFFAFFLIRRSSLPSGVDKGKLDSKYFSVRAKEIYVLWVSSSSISVFSVWSRSFEFLLIVSLRSTEILRFLVVMFRAGFCSAFFSCTLGRTFSLELIDKALDGFLVITLSTIGTLALRTGVSKTFAWDLDFAGGRILQIGDPCS